MESYPEAKVILTIRDPESWYESVKETIYQSNLDANIFPANIFRRRSVDIFLQKNEQPDF